MCEAGADIALNSDHENNAEKFSGTRFNATGAADPPPGPPGRQAGENHEREAALKRAGSLVVHRRRHGVRQMSLGSMRSSSIRWSPKTFATTRSF